jgi:CheY-like chemotaxis protein
MALAQDAPVVPGLRQLRHDLLNPLNVLVGAANGLAQSELNSTQRAWLRLLESSTARLQEIIGRIETYGDVTAFDGRERLADLCSIAAARVAKPIDRQRLVETLRAIVGARRARVLVVDDSPELATLVRTYLEGTGWDIDVVDTGERAVAQATTEPYDVLLMDIDLPGLDGATAAHAIRAADLARGASPTPIVAMTAFDSDSGDDRTTAPAIDDAAVALDDPEIAPLVPEFLEHRRADVAMFREALQAKDFSRLQSAAHKLKGTGRGYGFPAISRMGGELEVAAHQQDVHRIAQLIAELDFYLGRVRIV